MVVARSGQAQGLPLQGRMGREGVRGVKIRTDGV